MLQYLKTSNIGPAPTFELTLGERLNILTGDNGLGKTLLLDVAWWVCARDWPEGPAIPKRFVLPIEHRSARGTQEAIGDGEIVATISGRAGRPSKQTFVFDPRLADWKRKSTTRPPIAGLVIYARLDGGFSVWDPARHYYRVAPSIGIDDPDRPPAFHFSKEEVWNGKRISDRAKGEVTVCEGLSRDWLEWEKREPDLFTIFKNVLEHLSPPEELIRPADSPVRMPGPDVSSVPALSTAYGVVPLHHASAAMKRILALAYFLVWTWHEHELQSDVIGSDRERRIILIIDEVEAHLHPKWQRRLMPALLTVAKHLSGNVGVQFVVSTHSPLVLASLEPDFQEPGDRLFHLDLRDGEARLDQKPWVPYGDVGGWLTSQIFQLGAARSEPAEDVIESALKIMQDGSAVADDALIADIDDRLRRVLPPMDAVWASWTIFKRQRSMEKKKA